MHFDCVVFLHILLITAKTIDNETLQKSDSSRVSLFGTYLHVYILATTARFARLRCSLRLRRDILRENWDSIRAARRWSLLRRLGTLMGTMSLVHLGPRLEGPQGFHPPCKPILCKSNKVPEMCKNHYLQFFYKTMQYSRHCWIPMVPRYQNGTFWADPGPRGHWGA